jgi:peptide/nickel transport system permease protein
MTDVAGAAAAASSDVATAIPPAPSEAGGTGRRRRKKGKLGVGGWLSLLWLVFVTAAAVLAPILPLKAPDDPDYLVPANADIGTEGHPLGTDFNGFDILSRLAWGGRTSLLIGIGVLVAGMMVGGTIGLVAGFMRGRTESLLMSVIDIFLAFPALVFLIAVVAFLGQEMVNIFLAICLISIPYFARISRATTLSYAQREFVLAAEAAGASRKRILVREVLPNVVLPLLAFGLLAVAVAIVAEGSLAFLGLTAADTVSWGGMINDGREALQLDGIAHPALLPAVVLFLTVLSVNFLGERFRAAFDVKEAAL